MKENKKKLLEYNLWEIYGIKEKGMYERKTENSKKEKREIQGGGRYYLKKNNNIKKYLTVLSLN